MDLCNLKPTLVTTGVIACLLYFYDSDISDIEHNKINTLLKSHLNTPQRLKNIFHTDNLE